MADELKPDAEAWGQQDWADDERPAPPRKRRWLKLILGAVVVLLLLAGLFLSWERARLVQQQVAEAERLSQEQLLQAERVRAKQAKAEPTPVPKEEPEPEPPLGPPGRLQLMARDADALNNLGMYRLDNTTDIDGAVEALRAATRLDPKYAVNLKLALKRQEEQDRTAPFPREVLEP